MKRVRRDLKLSLLDALADGWADLSEEHQAQLLRNVELVRFRAGDSLGIVGTTGTWCTAVVKGAVATTRPPAVYPAGSAVQHGPETAVVCLENGLALTWPSRLLGPGEEPLRLYPVRQPTS